MYLYDEKIKNDKINILWNKILNDLKNITFDNIEDYQVYFNYNIINIDLLYEYFSPYYFKIVDYKHLYNLFLYHYCIKSPYIKDLFMRVDFIDRCYFDRLNDNLDNFYIIFHIIYNSSFKQNMEKILYSFYIKIFYFKKYRKMFEFNEGEIVNFYENIYHNIKQIIIHCFKYENFDIFLIKNTIIELEELEESCINKISLNKYNSYLLYLNLVSKMIDFNKIDINDFKIFINYYNNFKNIIHNKLIEKLKINGNMPCNFIYNIYGYGLEFNYKDNVMCGLHFKDNYYHFDKYKKDLNNYHNFVINYNKENENINLNTPYIFIINNIDINIYIEILENIQQNIYHPIINQHVIKTFNKLNKILELYNKIIIKHTWISLVVSISINKNKNI